MIRCVHPYCFYILYLKQKTKNKQTHVLPASQFGLVVVVNIVLFIKSNTECCFIQLAVQSRGLSLAIYAEINNVLEFMGTYPVN